MSSYDETRIAMRQLDPFARQYLGKSILDCDGADRLELADAIAADKAAWTAQLDQALARIDDLVGREARVQALGTADGALPDEPDCAEG